mmetsp:Transcript_34454/g.87088  ORF Transcript_34454/g.87088 Transcript_34454/m.87088 type:complete len:214 (+) Transcript_34454:130-771(+)
MRASTSRLFSPSDSRKRACASSAAFFSRSSLLWMENCSDATAIAVSRCRIASNASSHCLMRSCRSWCSLRKSSAALSSWICAACVSSTSASSSSFLPTTARLIFSSDSCSSLTLAASACRYFSSAALSSSFCRCASAHCSSSSWFQFMSSLKPSSFSLARKMLACRPATLSASSAFSAASLPTSLRRRPFSRSAIDCRCFSVSISLALASTLD